MEEFRVQLRLNTLQSVDAHAQNVAAVAARTALYNYDPNTESWSKTDVEGTLMIYTRNAKPKHMLTIVNKNSKYNFIEPITRNCDAQLKPPYVLLRDDKSKILGIWFAEEGDVQRIYEAINSFIRVEEQECASSGKDNISEPMPSGPIMAQVNAAVRVKAPNNTDDIMSMLSRAHGEYETKRTDGTDASGHTSNAAPQQSVPSAISHQTIDAVKPSSVRVESTPQNDTVADFFAKVGLGPPISAPKPVLPPQPPINNNSAAASNNCNSNPMLQQLFQGAAAVGGQASVINNNCTSNPVTIPGSSSNNTAVGGSLKNSGSLKTAPMSLQELEGKLRENLQVTVPTNNKEDPHPVPFTDLLLGVTNSKPNLITPQMFSTNKSLLEDSPLLDILHQPPQESAINRLHRQTSEPSGTPFRITSQAPPGGLPDALLSPTGNSTIIHDLLMSTDQSISNKNEVFKQQLHLQQHQHNVHNQQHHHHHQQHQQHQHNHYQPPNDTIFKQHRLPLTQSQFVLALSHALTKDEFVTQLYKAYEEVITKATSNG